MILRDDQSGGGDLSIGDREIEGDLRIRDSGSDLPRGQAAYRGKTYVINDAKVGPLPQKLYDPIVGIQYGKVKDAYGWIEKAA